MTNIVTAKISRTENSAATENAGIPPPMSKASNNSVGTMEAAMVLVMWQLGAELQSGLITAIAMRLATLWFGIAVGIVATLSS
jgi:hypothetical protein